MARLFAAYDRLLQTSPLPTKVSFYSLVFCFHSCIIQSQIEVDLSSLIQSNRSFTLRFPLCIDRHISDSFRSWRLWCSEIRRKNRPRFRSYWTIDDLGCDVRSSRPCLVWPVRQDCYRKRSHRSCHKSRIRSSKLATDICCDQLYICINFVFYPSFFSSHGQSH
jgi:hypothetical protein